jgi:hypothetical protein
VALQLDNGPQSIESNRHCTVKGSPSVHIPNNKTDSNGIDYCQFVECVYHVQNLSAICYGETLCFFKKNKIYTTLYSDVHSYNTIHKHNLYVQPCNTWRCKKSVTNMGIKIYNNLPFEIKTTQNFKAFKRTLKDYLLLNAFTRLKSF